MKKSILVTVLGLFLTTTTFIGAEEFSQDVVGIEIMSQDVIALCPKSCLPTPRCCPKKRKGATGPRGPAGSCLINTLSASSATSQTLDTSIDPLSFDAYEFNTDPAAIGFSPSTPTQFTLTGPGVFLIEASGILSTIATISSTDNVRVSLYNLTSAIAVSPSPLYNWEPGFAAPSGTEVGFGISRAIQLASGQSITYEIIAIASSANSFAVNNKVLSVTQLQ